MTRGLRGRAFSRKASPALGAGAATSTSTASQAAAGGGRWGRMECVGLPRGRRAGGGHQCRQQARGVCDLITGLAERPGGSRRGGEGACARCQVPRPGPPGPPTAAKNSAPAASAHPPATAAPIRENRAPKCVPGSGAPSYWRQGGARIGAAYAVVVIRGDRSAQRVGRAGPGGSSASATQGTLVRRQLSCAPGGQRGPGGPGV